MVYVRIRPPLLPMRKRIKVAHHVIVNFLLQINAERAIDSNHFICANARIGRNVASRIGNANVA